MPKFEFEWTEELFYRATIEADTKQEAIDLWSSGEYPEYHHLEHYGSEIQDGVNITEVED